MRSFPQTQRTLVATLSARRFDAQRLARLADGLAVAVAASLPWSTSATSILIVLWLLALIPMLDWVSLRQQLARPEGGLPVLLLALGAIGTLWATAPWGERLGGFESFVRFSAIPLLMVQFRQSDRGMLVLTSFVASCTVLLVLSTALVLIPRLGQAWPHIKYGSGIPVKDYTAQSGEFLLCAFALAPLVLSALRNGKWTVFVALSVLEAGFLTNIFYVATGRTTLVVIPLLFAIFCLREFGWRGTVSAAIIALIAGGIVWASSPYLRARVLAIPQEIATYRVDAPTSAGQRLDFWQKSLGFLAEAPIIGHGTGSILETFRRSDGGEGDAPRVVVGNPHNQTLTIALQLGLVGSAVLYAMWFAHLLLFWRAGFASWIGLIVVASSIVGSLFNSFLFDFTQGWIYVFGVGVAGGMAARAYSKSM